MPKPATFTAPGIRVDFRTARPADLLELGRLIQNAKPSLEDFPADDGRPVKRHKKVKDV